MWLYKSEIKAKIKCFTTTDLLPNLAQTQTIMSRVKVVGGEAE